MDDRIRMHDYSKEQLLLLIEDYVTINFQGMKYQTKRITSAIRKELMESFFGLSDIHFSERIGLDRIDHIDGISFGFEKWINWIPVMTGGFHAKDTGGITDVFEYKSGDAHPYLLQDDCDIGT